MHYPLTQGIQLNVNSSDWATSTPNRAQMADIIAANCPFAQDAGGNLYVYKNGVYRPNGDRAVAELAKRVLVGLGRAQSWSTNYVKETTEFIRTGVPLLWERPDPRFLNLSNGLLDVDSRVLHPHSPHWLSTVQIPVNYDPPALCPTWDWFNSTTFPEDAPNLIYEIIAWLMMPMMYIQNALLLLGFGANGKSTFLKACTKFLGDQNVSSISLHKLESDRFAASGLIGKLANICPDIPNVKLTGTSMFKAITGGDRIYVERKYGHGFDMQPMSRLVFSANDLPPTDDSSEGFLRRWIIPPFNRTFEANPEIGAQLDAALVQPSEFSGVLNKALALLPRVTKRGITISPSMIEMIEEYRGLTDPVDKWLDANIVLDPSQTTIKRYLLDAYNATAKVKISPKRLGTAVKRKFPDVRDVQHMVEGKNAHCYEGIRYVGPPL